MNCAGWTIPNTACCATALQSNRQRVTQDWEESWCSFRCPSLVEGSGCLSLGHKVSINRETEGK